jgi:acetyl-CoA/propionyl-CoA carboxylase biotin carboxyl carrier protein
MADIEVGTLLVRVRPGRGEAGDPAFEIGPGELMAADLKTGDAHGASALVRPGNGGSVREVEVVSGGWRFELVVEDARQAALREKARRGTSDVASRGPVEVRAIIPGRVVSVDVGVGDEVEAGGHLLVLEAMKMQNELLAPTGGRIERVAVSAGLTVDRGDLLVVIKPSPLSPNAQLAAPDTR